MNARTWKAWLVPGGLLLALAAGLVSSSLFAQAVPSLSFYYVAVFAAGLALAWRFNSSRVLFSLLVLLLAHRAVDFFAAGQTQSGPGRMAVLLSAVLVPLNLACFALMRERGLVAAGIAPRFGLLFVESVMFAVACRPENSPSHVNRAGAVALPAWVLLSFLVAAAVFVRRYFQTRKPIEPGFAWCAATVCVWLRLAPLGKAADAYVATAALILGASLIETSYVLAYHDELTGIRGRRAFNEALLSLGERYAIAIVDIDHFKKFNDTYGHEVGDQVLCMVASRLTQVGGGGAAFRCGGEEFSIIFRDTSAKDAHPHLEDLRRTIEQSQFKVRGADRRAEKSAVANHDRRKKDPDRRRATRKKAASSGSGTMPDHLSVTVSVGVAEPSTRYREPDRVIQAADQALYRAKDRGRNRVEAASTGQLKLAFDKEAKASRG